MLKGKREYEATQHKFDSQQRYFLVIINGSNLEINELTDKLIH